MIVIKSNYENSDKKEGTSEAFENSEVNAPGLHFAR